MHLTLQKIYIALHVQLSTPVHLDSLYINNGRYFQPLTRRHTKLYTLTICICFLYRMNIFYCLWTDFFKLIKNNIK